MCFDRKKLEMGKGKREEDEDEEEEENGPQVEAERQGGQAVNGRSRQHY